MLLAIIPILALTLSQAPSAHLLEPQETEAPSAKWKVFGTLGGAITGAAASGAFALTVRAPNAPLIFLGGLAVGGLLSAWFGHHLGVLATDGDGRAKVAVIILDVLASAVIAGLAVGAVYIGYLAVTRLPTAIRNIPD